MGSASVRVIACASVALLAACSTGGGDDGIDPVSLSTKADVIREIGNVASMRGEGPMMQPASTAQARRSGARGFMAPSASGQARGSRGKGYAPAAEETVPCDSGSMTYEDFIGARNYPLFGVTPPSTDYSVYQYRDCVDNTYYPWVETSDGRVELGYSDSTAQTPAYYYEVLGSGSTPYVSIAEDKSTGDRYTGRVLGRSESRDTGSVWQSRENLTVGFRSTFGGDIFTMDVDVGDDGNPLVITNDYSVDTLAVDGPISYSSSACEGGRVEFTTLEPMTFGYDDSGMRFVNGGQIVIEAGGRSVTVTFQSDGGASYQFNDGASGTISRDEVSDGECLFGP